MNIHQLSVRYVPEQDRILLSVNTTDGQELELWLTRRMCLALWPRLNLLVVDHFAVPANAASDGCVDLTALDANTRKVLTQARSQELLRSADFKTPYRSGSSTRPLGDKPLLATEITMTTQAAAPGMGQQADIQFKEQIAQESCSRGVQLALQPQLIFSLMQMLRQAMEHAQWLDAEALSTGLIPNTNPRAAMAAPNTTTDAVGFDDLERPRYLN